MDETLQRYVEGRCGKCEKVREHVNPAYLRDLRKRAGITLRELARRNAVSAAWLSQIELGQCPCSVKWLEVYERLGVVAA